MGIPSHLSWANFLTVQATHFPNLIPFLFFSLQETSVYGYVKIVMEGNTVSYIADYDTSNQATITGTAIVDMQPGQKVSDSHLFFMLHT